MELPLISSGEHTHNEGDSNSNLPLLPRIAKQGLRGPLSPINDLITSAEDHVRTFYSENKKTVNTTFFVIFALTWLAYTVVAAIMDLKRSRDLLIVTGFATFCVFYWFMKKQCGNRLKSSVCDPACHFVTDEQRIKLSRIIISLFFVAVLVWLIVDSRKEPRRLISLVGLLVFPAIGFLFSRHRGEIKWQPVLRGFIVQFLLGLFTLRTTFGYHIFRWICDVVVAFLGFAHRGGEFLLGTFIIQQGMILVLPILIYVSAFTYALYYLGILQVPASKIAWGLRAIMSTSSTETFNAVLNVFVGQVEAPVFIRPFLNGMTESELHAIMAAGFSTISGSLFAVYVSFGISPEHLLTAAVMSAPASLAMSKLICPETDESETKELDEIEIGETEEKNLFEAISVGAMLSVNIVINIAVLLIAFISILFLIDGVLGWIGSKVGLAHLSFEFICSYLLMPFAFIMGVPYEDSFKVAELIGIKTFLNEMVAYKRLAAIIKNKTPGVKISPRAVMIATYALCGFANFGSMGMQVGGLSALAPTRKTVFSKLVVTALIAGSLASFMTASISGLLTDSEHLAATVVHVNTTASF